MAEVPAPEAADASTEGAPTMKKTKKHSGGVLPILLTALVVGPLAIAGFQMISKKSQPEPEKKEKTTAKAPYEKDSEDLETVVWPLDVQTVNLADGDRYARCGVSLAFELDAVDAHHFLETQAAMSGEEKEAPKPPESKEKSEKKEPSDEVVSLLFILATQGDAINDLLIQEIGARKYADLLANADKAKLKQSLQTRLDELLTESGLTVHDIYLSEFVMQ